MSVTNKNKKENEKINFINCSGHNVNCIYDARYCGSAEADYETSVESAGIGQVNFKVCPVVKTDMTIVSPLMDKRISIMRKLMLVNTVFSGEVPEAFYGGKQ